jgi:hypothetical protein
MSHVSKCRSLKSPSTGTSAFRQWYSKSVGTLHNREREFSPAMPDKPLIEKICDPPNCRVLIEVDFKEAHCSCDQADSTAKAPVLDNACCNCSIEKGLLSLIKLVASFPSFGISA